MKKNTKKAQRKKNNTQRKFTMREKIRSTVRRGAFRVIHPFLYVQRCFY